MKKLVLLVLTLILALSVLVACGGSEDSEKGGDKEITTTEFDAGNVSVSVPSGWKAFPVTDIWAEPAANDPNKIMVIKGGESDADVFTKPYVNILYYKDVEMMLSLDEMKEFYEETEDIESFTAGDINWNGFINKATNAIILISDDQKFQVDIFAETYNGNISLEDADVKIILESIKPSAATEDATEAA
ncbi:MAG: hypothetical protein E7615_03630 [Ruminococcaceae bacterium]|nr:hypothetical protein [Oscillospiraceae bacterium]